jgi:hypothetical protein
MDARHVITYGVMALMAAAIVMLLLFDRRKRAEHRRIMQGRNRYPVVKKKAPRG